MQTYSDPSRRAEPHALPDVEVFYHKVLPDYGAIPEGEETLEEGWYYWHCFPGCLPDSDAVGPFASAEAAEAAAIEEAQ